MSVSAITATERMRGFVLTWAGARESERNEIESPRLDYLRSLSDIRPCRPLGSDHRGRDHGNAANPASPAHRTRRMAESRSDSLTHWRFDCLIAATAPVARLPLMHNNALGFEAIRSAIEVSPEGFPKIGLIRCASLVGRGSD
jgi:hypothetical protein